MLQKFQAEGLIDLFYLDESGFSLWMPVECGRIRVIVQDNGPIHTSKAVQAKWSQWQLYGLYLFELPKYCSEMNLIETEWHQLKRDELVGRMFEDELLELAYAVIDGIDARAEAGKYVAERFRFPSKLNTS